MAVNFKKADEAAEAAEAAEAPATVTFSSHPIQNFRIGNYQFVNSQLVVAEKDAQGVRNMLDKLPLSERQKIQEVSVEAAEEYLRNLGASAVTVFDSATAKLKLQELQKSMPAVGTKAVDGE